MRCQKGDGEMFVVVAYASKCGSTAEVAQCVARELRTKGCEVEVADVRKMRKLPECDAVVLGTAVRMGKPLAAMRAFVKRNLRQIKLLPVAVFSVGIAPRAGTPESGQEAMAFVRPIAEACDAREVACFAGAIFPDRLTFPFNRAALNPDGPLSAGDYRDWVTIGNWAEALPTVLAV